MNDTPAPLSADSLREQIEEAAMYGFIEGAYDIHGIPIQSIDKLEALIAAALQSQRQRIADSLPGFKVIKHDVSNYEEGESQGFNDCLEAVRAVLIPPAPGDLEDRSESAS